MKQKFTVVPDAAERLLSILPEEYMLAIGNIAFQWSTLEMIIEGACWQSSGVRNDIGQIFTAQMQMQSKLDVVQTLLTHKHPKLAQRFKPVSNYIRDCLIGKRNLIMHGTWMPDPETSKTYIRKFSARGTLVSHSREIPLEELHDLARDIADVSAWMMELVSRLPSLKERRGGLGHKSQDIQSLPDFPTRKKNALLPLTSRLKSQSPQKGKRRTQKKVRKLKRLPVP